MSRLLNTLSFLLALLAGFVCLAPVSVWAQTDYQRVMNAANDDPVDSTPKSATSGDADSTTTQQGGYNPKNISIYGQPQFHNSPGTSLLAPAPNQAYGSRAYNSYATTAQPSAVPVTPAPTDSSQ